MRLSRDIVFFEPGEISAELASDDEYRRMIAALSLFRPGEEITAFIWDAYNSVGWSFRSSDGCTGCSETYFPKGFRFPPCVAHDYYCWLGRKDLTWRDELATRRKGDRLFYEAMRAFGVSRPRARWRWLGVRLYWWAWGKWARLHARIGRRIERAKEGIKFPIDRL